MEDATLASPRRPLAPIECATSLNAFDHVDSHTASDRVYHICDRESAVREQHSVQCDGYSDDSAGIERKWD